MERILSVELVGLTKAPYVNVLRFGDIKEVTEVILGLENRELDAIQKMGKRFEVGIKYSHTFVDKNLLSFLNQRYTLRI